DMTHTQQKLPRFPLAAVARHPHILARFVVVSVAATTVLQSLVSGALTVALPTIADDLGLSADRLQWPMTCLSLANGALLLIAGAIADTIAGRRRTFLAGLAAFTLSAAATAFVQSGTELSALCACIGAAAAMLSPAGVGILAGCLPDEGQFKSRAFAALGAGQPVGFIVGLLLGGILSTGGHWRFIFWITAAIAFCFLVLCFLVLPADGSIIVFDDYRRRQYQQHQQQQRQKQEHGRAAAAAATSLQAEADSTRHLTSGAATPARLSTGSNSGRPRVQDLISEEGNATTSPEIIPLERITSLVSIASESQRPPLGQALWHFDWLGALLSTSGLVLLTFALADGETAPQGWRTPYIPAMLPLSTLALTSFVLWERRLERAAIAKRQRGERGLTFEPLLPPAIWRAPRFGLLLLIVFTSWLSFNTLSYFITVFIQVVQHVSPLQTSLRFIPMIVTGILINVLSGWLMPKIRPVWMITVGSSGGCAAAVLYSLLSPSSNYWKGMLFVMMLVVATDFAFPVAQLFSVRSAGRRHAALAGSLFSTTVRVASSIGLALTSAISTAVARQYAAAHPKDPATGEPMEPTAPEALLRGYRAAGWTCAGFSLLAVLLAFVALRDVGPLRSDDDEAVLLGGGAGEEGAIKAELDGKGGAPADPERSSEAVPFESGLGLGASGVPQPVGLVGAAADSPSTTTTTSTSAIELQPLGVRSAKAMDASDDNKI
ncbi:hypothetical protein OC842_007469, partial [Tilletia horrida]